MDHRTEPRSQVSLPIRVILPGPPAEVLECSLMDVSATGLRFASDVTLVTEELVAIEVEDQLVLAQIRHCHPEGEKFIAGVRRLHQVPKGAQRGEIGEYVAGMIEDLERRVLAGEEVASRMLALEALDRIVGRTQLDHTAPKPQPAPVKLPAPTQSATPSENTEQPTKSSWRIPLALAAGLVLAGGITFSLVQSGKTASPEVAVKITPSPAATPVPVAAAPAPLTTPVPVTPPATPQTAAVSPAPVKPVPVAAVPEKKPAPAPEKPQTAPPVAVAAGAGTHHARVTILTASWVSVNADGKQLFGKVMQKGEAQDFDFSGKALVHVGNGAGVEVSVDGKSVGPIGGTLRMFELTASGKRFLPWQNETPASH